MRSSNQIYTPPRHPYDDDPHWAASAACKGLTELFYPARGENYHSVRNAKKVCETCPIKQKCLDYAIHHNEIIGVWGGTTDRERAAIKRKRNKPTS